MSPTHALTNEAHTRLLSLVGDWLGTTRTWLKPGELYDESPQRGTIRLLLDGRFLLYEYEGMMHDQPLQGAAIVGYSLDTHQFEAAWVDTWHMGTSIMFCTGKSLPDGFSVLGSYQAPGTPPWGWRTEIVLLDIDHMTITVYNISPEGQEAKAVETIYTRQP